jgi:hypothetical protein
MIKYKGLGEKERAKLGGGAPGNLGKLASPGCCAVSRSRQLAEASSRSAVIPILA